MDNLAEIKKDLLLHEPACVWRKWVELSLQVMSSIPEGAIPFADEICTCPYRTQRIEHSLPLSGTVTMKVIKFGTGGDEEA